LGTYGLRVPASRVGYVPEAQGGLPPGPRVLYVRGTRTSHGRTAYGTPVPWHPRCWTAREAAAVSGRAALATATVEYGPSEHSTTQHGARGDYAGYTPIDRAGAPVAGCGLDETLASACAELREHFEVWHRDVQRRMDV
jgi:hypothetical protein